MSTRLHPKIILELLKDLSEVEDSIDPGLKLELALYKACFANIELRELEKSVDSLRKQRGGISA